MTHHLSYGWMETFDSYVGKTPNRMATLFLYHYSDRGASEMISSLKKVEVTFLPPNTTSRIQPMDAGVITLLKVKYHKSQMERAINLIDDNIRGTYKINILSALRLLTRIWLELPHEISENC